METNTELNTLKSTAYGTDDSAACSFCWYAARTQMNCERRAEKEFKNIATETYLPTQKETHTWSDRKKTIQRVVIPMILFVKMNSDEVKNVRRTSYFYGFLGHDKHDRAPEPIPDRDIEILRFMLGQSDAPVTIESLPLSLGDKVRVVRGKLRGLEGYVAHCDEGHSYVIVKLSLLGCAKTQISRSDIEKM